MLSVKRNVPHMNKAMISYKNVSIDVSPAAGWQSLHWHPGLWCSCGQRNFPLNGSVAFLFPKAFLMPNPPECTLGYSSSMKTLDNPHWPRM